MDTRQSKLVKTAEEAAEVAKEALKAVHFPGREYKGKTAEEHLRDELMDLLVCKRTLEYLRIIRPITNEDILLHYQSKHAKIEKYTGIARDLGALDEAWIPPLDMCGE